MSLTGHPGSFQLPPFRKNLPPVSLPPIPTFQLSETTLPREFPSVEAAQTLPK